MAVDEATLASWTGPSSATEQEKQERTERMIREAVAAHAAFRNVDLRVFAKGSYPNRTNVRADSDVDMAVQCNDVLYWDAATGVYVPTTTYTGIWRPDRLRYELGEALKAKFGAAQVSAGTTAFTVRSSSARVDADVVPCFTYRWYWTATQYREGHKVFRTTGASVINWPQQHYDEGVTKNVACGGFYKKAVRILKRAANNMERSRTHRAVPSFLVECLVYNCPDHLFTDHDSWRDTIEGLLVAMFGYLDKPEPTTGRWVEVNEMKYLFSSDQKWTRQDGRDFVLAAWRYIGYSS